MAGSYHLGVDVGTSRVAAATARLAHDGSVLATHVPLGRRSDHVPAVVFVTADGDLLFGDAAERRGLVEPERLLREFRRSVGDDVPMLIAGHPRARGVVRVRPVRDRRHSGRDGNRGAVNCARQPSRSDRNALP